MKTPNSLQSEYLLYPDVDSQRATNVAAFVLRELYLNAEPSGDQMRFMTQDVKNRLTIVFTDESQNIIATAGLVTKAGELTAEVVDVAVDPVSRGLGVGKRAMESLETLALERKLENLMTYPTDDAVGFYENLGYSLQGSVYIKELRPKI